MELNGQTLTLTEIATMVFGEAPVKVSSSARPRVLASRKVIEDIVGRDDIVYGVSTGFGKLSDVRIPHDALAELQLNLVRSHACGIGNPLSEPEVRAMMLLRAKRLIRVVDVAGATSLEALKGTPAAFDPRLQDARPHPGQREVAKHLMSILEGSDIRRSHLKDDPRIQDAYSLRCMPQVHGAIRDALSHCENVLLIESGSATDNPLVFSESGDVISGGNFHGAPLALTFDYAAIALTDLMSISERRIERLVNPDMNEGLPAFLARRPGMESGFMIAHVAAAALLNEAKVLAHPSSVDSVPTSGGKEDHVAMGMTGALKLRTIVDLAENLAAIELLAGAEALEHRRPLKAGVGVERAFTRLWKTSPPLTPERSPSGDIARVAEAIRRGDFDTDYEPL